MLTRVPRTNRHIKPPARPASISAATITWTGQCACTQRSGIAAPACTAAHTYCSSRKISSCSGTVSKVPVPAGICISGLPWASSSHTLG